MKPANTKPQRSKTDAPEAKQDVFAKSVINSAELLDWLTQAGMPLTDRRLRQIADQGYFPPPVRGDYKLQATLVGMIRYKDEMAKKANDKGSTKDKIQEQILREKKVIADEAEKKVVDKEEGRRVVTRYVVGLKFKLLGIPKRLSQRLAIEGDPVKVELAIEGEIREAFTSNKFEWGLQTCPKCKAKIDL